MSDKILQILAFIFCLTLPVWAGWYLDIQHDNFYIEQTER